MTEEETYPLYIIPKGGRGGRQFAARSRSTTGSFCSRLHFKRDASAVGGGSCVLSIYRSGFCCRNHISFSFCSCSVSLKLCSPIYGMVKERPEQKESIRQHQRNSF